MLGNCVTKSTRNAWETALKQLDNISWEEAFDLSFSKSRVIVKIALLIAPIYQGSQDKNKLDVVEMEQVEKINDNLTSGLNSKWSFIWYLHNRLLKTEEYEGKYELCPSVVLVANVEEKNTLKGYVEIELNKKSIVEPTVI